MDAWISEVRSLLQGRLKEVLEQARDLGNRYLQAVMDANRGQEWKRKNTLQFRVRQRGNAIALEWYVIAWYGGTGQDRQMRRSRHTSGWDDDLVSAVETEASEYRRQAHYLADMLVTLGRLQRFTQAQPSDTPGEHTP